MAKELSTRINPKEYETAIYKSWIERRLFHADEGSKKPAYSIVIPPPNVTGSLHMGHALDETLQDILIRFKRLKGFEALWAPGTDHAGIATQNVVEKQLALEGKTRHEIGREAFIERVWKWKAQSGGKIINQLKALGCSCDWERERFTMDEGLSKAVRHVFVSLYKEGLIYRSNYMVNWCVRCHTALSDLEVEFEERDDFLYHLRYPLEGEDGFVEVATTRPETYLGDTAVAVHPKDERYKNIIGKNVILPVVGRKIPVIDDEFVETEFGTGCVKITPAHDPNDFAAGKRHSLEEIVCLDDNGNIAPGVCSVFEGMDRTAARKAVVEKFAGLGLLGDIEPLKHNVGCCYRCSSVIEPRVSVQWFVKVKPLALKAVEAVKKGYTHIIPKQWENTYFEWMENIRDWCVSRQIWWGHRIPAWYCDNCGHITVSEYDSEVCEKCGSPDIRQETDVLDTWFSSSLWPFSILGYPDKTDALKKFYPTSALVTGFDILFFWVARMMMMGIKFMGEVPFKDVYLHGLVRDEKGQKMSKSKGNVIDPLLMIEKYGADAFRFALAVFAAQGRNIKMDPERIEGYRNFINKIWNASRFVMMNSEKAEKYFSENKVLKKGGSEKTFLCDVLKISPEKPNEIDPAIADKLLDEDKWIIAKLEKAAKNAASAIESYRFNDGASELYQFFWMTFCDWYLEIIKDRLFKGDPESQAVAAATAAFVLERSAAALHPFIPFVTEYIYRRLKTEEDSLTFEKYPDGINAGFEKEEKKIDAVISLISTVRNLRGEYNAAPGAELPIFIKTGDASLLKSFKESEALIKRMAKASRLSFEEDPPVGAVCGVGAGFEARLSLEGAMDVSAEISRLEKEKKAALKDFDLYGGKLKNERYLEKAPREVVEKDRKTFEEAQARLEKIDDALKRLRK